MQSLLFMMWVSVSSRPACSSTIACSQRAAALWSAKVSRLDWWCAYWERVMYKIVSLRQPLVLMDKQAGLRQAATEAQEARSDPKLLYSIVRKLAGIKSRPLQGINDSDGKALVDRGEITDSWRGHFVSIFKAKVVEDLDANPHIPEDRPADITDFALPADFAPTLEHVIAAINALKNSGVGDDGVSALVLRAGGLPVAHHLHRLIVELCSLGYIPISWRGGRLVVIFKKGQARCMDNYRGILVANHVAKVIAMLLYRFISPTYHKQIGQRQYGAAKNRGTALASLTLRTFGEACSAQSFSWAVLFLDLSKAFDFALRETVMGWMQCASFSDIQAKAQHLQSLGVPAGFAMDLANEIDAKGGLLAECMGEAPRARALVASLHDKAWFKLDDDTRYIETAAGGRQGCILGPVVFNLIYSIALARVRRRLADLGILWKARAAEDKPFWACRGSKWSPSNSDTADSSIFEVAFVDDVAAMIAAKCAADLVQILTVMVEELAVTLRALGFKVNWDEGKTEAIVSLRGKRSHDIRRHIVELGGMLPIDTDKCGCSSLRIVEEYKHLGCKLGRDLNPAPDVESRVSKAMSSYCPISQKVFGAVQVGRRLRMQLFFSLVVSRLVYCVHTWGTVSSMAYRRLNAVYMRGLRKIAGACRINHASAKAITDSQVREQLGAMSLQCLLVRRRLLLLSQVIRHGGVQLAALLSTKRSDGSQMMWTKQSLSDMQLLLANSRSKLDDLGDPQVWPHRWEQFIKCFPQQWAQIVRTLCIVVMPADDNSSLCRQHLLGPQGGHKFACSSCEKVFMSTRALQTHIRVRHQSYSDHARFVGSSLRCPVCCTQFSCRSRLVAHLAESGREARGHSPATRCLPPALYSQLVPRNSKQLASATAMPASEQEGTDKPSRRQRPQPKG